MLGEDFDAVMDILAEQSRPLTLKFRQTVPLHVHVDLLKNQAALPHEGGNVTQHISAFLIPL